MSQRAFSAIADALDMLCLKAAQHNRTDETKEQLQSLLADEGIAVTSLLPNLKRFLKEEDEDDGSSSSSEDRRQSASKHSFIRMKAIMVNVIRILAGSRVLVLFLDDLQVSTKKNDESSEFGMFSNDNAVGKYGRLGANGRH
jgi:predicted ATPase